MKQVFMLGVVLAIASTASAQLTTKPAQHKAPKKDTVIKNEVKEPVAKDSISEAHRKEGTGFRTWEMNKNNPSSSSQKTTPQTPGNKTGYMPQPNKAKPAKFAVKKGK